MTNLSKTRLSIIIGTSLAFAACGDTGSNTETKTPEASQPATTEQPAATETPAPVKSADVSEEAQLKRGRIVWFKCRSCHETSVDGPHKVGPNLNGIFGAEAGKKEGFKYSDAMTSSGIVWTAETMDSFVEKPSNFIKGTKMAFVGIRKESDRQALIRYLEENTKSGE